MAFNTPQADEVSASRVGGDADHNGYPDIVLVADEGSGYTYQNHARFYRESSAAGNLEIKPVFPRGGETFRVGSVLFVDWLSAVPAGGPATVSLELSVHGPGGPWQPLAAGLANGGRYQWRIPPGTLATNDAFIRYTLTVSPEIATALTPAAFTILGGAEEPIDGLIATSDSPTVLGLPMTFTATVTAGSNVDYEWAFGDGAFGGGSTASHTYPAAGGYTAAVTASNSLSLVTATVTVAVEEAIAGLAAWNDGPTLLGQPTALTATVTAGSHVSFTWAFGDGQLGTGPTARHVYPAAGAYTAVVTAANPVGVVTATTGVMVLPLTWRVYLPVVVRTGSY